MTDSEKAMAAANDGTFQARVRYALVQCALVAIDQDHAVRAAYAQKVLTNAANLAAAAVAVVTNPSIATSIAAEGSPTPTFGVDDAAIAFVVAEANDPAVGVFAKLALANATGR